MLDGSQTRKSSSNACSITIKALIMYMAKLCCNACDDAAKSGLSGLMRLSDVGSSIGGAVGGSYGGPVGAAFGSAIGGALTGGGGGAAPGNIVSTNVNTNVSPQISPNFIQQQQPTNSAINASTSQTMPDPFGIGLPTVPSALPYGAVPQTATPNYNMLIFGALAAVGVAIAVKKSKKSPTVQSKPLYKQLN